MDVSDDERRRPIGAVVRMDDDIEPTSARANSRGDGGANATRATRFLSIENLPGKTRPTHAREMCGDFGVVKRAVVDVGALKPGTSEMKILVEFEDAEACARARDALDGANVEGLTARCDFARGLSAGGRASILERLELPRGAGRNSGARGHHHQGSSRGYGREMHRDANDVGPGAREDERRFGRKRARSMSPPRRDHRRSSRDRSPPSRENHSLVARDMGNRRSVDEGRRLLVGAVVVGRHRRRGTVALGAVVREVSVEAARAVATASIAVEAITTARGRMIVVDVDTIAETIKIKTKTTTETAGTVEPRMTNLAGAAATAR
eukprot:CAMPEP_0179705664 /NCGR_PEP_ID=MMETSP0937-20121108/3946_1 /TAXON_ID=548131 ORGANISM="Ostreococcus mediterraneus, Strain clade-D-RCC2593" /NCGR_SAMPLE_ID=MMETSP0937 /ASSEMBLY_ACC=CAM_ASM_000575 /LENGTH=322 /DNA_ID=CAMNT_0021578909 /DNA_START=96 /DNA_END=1065 /DNA_ORIENTATION=+